MRHPAGARKDNENKSVFDFLPRVWIQTSAHIVIDTRESSSKGFHCSFGHRHVHTLRHARNISAGLNEKRYACNVSVRSCSVPCQTSEKSNRGTECQFGQRLTIHCVPPVPQLQ